ncbi:hypothetical protein [Hufsiella ginkgonis]|uniref:Right-handed parallel beta-helix repeat-containing protein n=1 Tax=Hufsiella ginkgonis TaxID=2695274 RepID=A0A7K1Y264_9SPHI|nr:hypothetical protein [Hufsiella ginkgonis]MXV17364.1 hypothetical protein [Hufsiella ginkgonis]
MRIFVLIFFSAALLASGCRKEDKISYDPSARLSFSGTSLFFDTLFTGVESASRRVTIYNRHDHALRISWLKLGRGKGSPFDLIIDGKSADSAGNIMVRGKDSLIVFIKATVPPTAEVAAFDVRDSITVLINGNRQSVELTAFGQNVNFYNDSIINQDRTWNNRLPYLVYRTLVVEANKTLTIQRGCRIYFHKDARLFVRGTLRVEGSFAEPVSFSGDRLEKLYTNLPGQWSGIHFSGTSTNNLIRNAVIRNALTAIRSDSVQGIAPKLVLANSIVKNMQVSGFSGYRTSLAAFNNLFYNCGQYLFYGAFGGTYNLKQNTFANEGFIFPRQMSSVYFSDFDPGKTPVITGELSLTLVNNIIWGSLATELVIERKATTGAATQLLLTNLFKTSNTSLLNPGNNFNADPFFISPQAGIYRLGNMSPALNKGIDLSMDPDFNNYLSVDLQNTKRNFPSEAGSYEN